MSFLLDSCVLSEMVNPQPDPRVVAWLDEIDERSLYLSVLTIGEILKGVARLPDGERRARLARWVEDDLSVRFEGRLLDVTPEVATEWGRLSGEAEARGEKLPVVDSLLAATARVGGLAVVTRNAGDFTRCGAAVLDPWTT